MLTKIDKDTEMDIDMGIVKERKWIDMEIDRDMTWILSTIAFKKLVSSSAF